MVSLLTFDVTGGNGLAAVFKDANLDAAIEGKEIFPIVSYIVYQVLREIVSIGITRSDLDSQAILNILY